LCLRDDVDMMDQSEARGEGPGKLWVDRYAPRTYTDLLSEEVKQLNLFFSLAFGAYRESLSCL